MTVRIFFRKYEKYLTEGPFEEVSLDEPKKAATKTQEPAATKTQEPAATKTAVIAQNFFTEKTSHLHSDPSDNLYSEQQLMRMVRID